MWQEPGDQNIGWDKWEDQIETAYVFWVISVVLRKA